ncbi:PilX N-terminal domain-containing pilus assembly protein, partial [Thermodesulfobacteriota bacterium]
MGQNILKMDATNHECCLKEKSIIRKEDGNVLLISLILLVLLTMIGIAATRTASIDIQIAGNNMAYTRNFYTAEAASLEAIQRMEDIDLENEAPNWVLADTVTEA